MSNACESLPFEALKVSPATFCCIVFVVSRSILSVVSMNLSLTLLFLPPSRSSSWLGYAKVRNERPPKVAISKPLPSQLFPQPIQICNAPFFPLLSLPPEQKAPVVFGSRAHTNIGLNMWISHLQPSHSTLSFSLHLIIGRLMIGVT